MNLIDLNAAVDFLKCHGATRSSDRGLWFTESGGPLSSCPVESAESLRRELMRADMNSGKKRWLDGGKIEL